MANNRKKSVKIGEYVELGQRYSAHPQILDNLDSVSWDMLANLASSFRVGLESDQAHAFGLAKEIQLTRMVLVERLKGHSSGTVALDAKFLVDLINLLSRLEEKEKAHKVKLRNFMNFIYLLVEKMKREKLVVFDKAQGKYVDSLKSKRLGLNSFSRSLQAEKIEK
ncbi:hypothetical protein FJZ26_01480 [Candidatus Parvarchaeota archaeon]|nr:hypothetical protein [Candidatus Parvarchaeota archaeon]